VVGGFVKPLSPPLSRLFAARGGAGLAEQRRFRRWAKPDADAKRRTASPP